MAWSIVGVSTNVEVTATGHTLTVPAGVAQGDLLVACISSRIASTTSITLPTGGEWTLVGEQKANNILTTGSALPSAMMAWCVRGASNPNLTFTHPTAPSVALGRIVAYRGGATVSPRDGAAAAATTGTGVTAVSLAGMTTTQADDLIVAMAAGGQEATWTSFNATSPSGASGATDTTTAPSATWRERAEQVTTTGVDTSLGIFDAVKTAAGATGNFTVTAGTAAGHSIIAGAFKIAPAAVNVTASVTGQAIAASTGDATIQAKQNVSTAITGHAIAVSAGDVSVATPGPLTSRSYAVAGPLGAGYIVETSDRDYAAGLAYVSETVAAAPPTGDITVNVTGQSVTASVGDVSVGAGTSVGVPVEGQAVMASVGDATVETPVTVIARSYAVGGPLGAGYVVDTGDRDYAVSNAYVSETAIAAPPSPDVSVSVTGQSLTVSAGTVLVDAKQAITVPVLGQSITASVGAVIVTAEEMAGVGVWTGSAWIEKPAKVWNGSAWMQKPVKHWNGSAWV